MTGYEIQRALDGNRKTWLAGLDAGSKIIFRSAYTSKVVRVDRSTKTMLMLDNGKRVSRKTGLVIGYECQEIRQLLTCSPQFQPGTELAFGRTLLRGEERGVEECIRALVIAGMVDEG